jgi:hypothetical protein
MGIPIPSQPFGSVEVGQRASGRSTSRSRMAFQSRPYAVSGALTGAVSLPAPIGKWRFENWLIQVFAPMATRSIPLSRLPMFVLYVLPVVALGLVVEHLTMTWWVLRAVRMKSGDLHGEPPLECQRRSSHSATFGTRFAASTEKGHFPT